MSFCKGSLISWTPQDLVPGGAQVPCHLGPSSSLGLGIHPVQLLEALAQDVLDVFYQLLYLPGQASETRAQRKADDLTPRADNKGTPGLQSHLLSQGEPC